MKSIMKFIKKTWWLFLSLFLAPIGVITVFAILEYGFHRIDMSAGEWAELLGGAFGYWGTVVLGTLAFWQNDRVQENNNLLIEYEKSKLSPVFSLKLEGYTGYLQNVKFRLLNCSDNIAYGIVISNLSIYKVTAIGECTLIECTAIATADSLYILGAHEDRIIEYNNQKPTISSSDTIQMIVSVTASDVIGLMKKTTVKLLFDNQLKCNYSYIVESVVEKHY